MAKKTYTIYGRRPNSPANIVPLYFPLYTKKIPLYLKSLYTKPGIWAIIYLFGYFRFNPLQKRIIIIKIINKIML